MYAFADARKQTQNKPNQTQFKPNFTQNKPNSSRSGACPYLIVWGAQIPTGKLLGILKPGTNFPHFSVLF
jgi:hypothetical protein